MKTDVDPGGIPEIRHGETGLLVWSRDPGAMAQAVARGSSAPESAVVLARQVWESVSAYTTPRVRVAWAGAYAGEA